jgi:hypothetical protein
LKQMRMQRHLYLAYRQNRPLSAAAQELVTILRGKPAARRSQEQADPHHS